MRRHLLLFPFVAAVAAFVACDPDLKIQGSAGDAGPEGGRPPVTPPPSDDSGAGDGGDDASGGDGGPDGGKSHQVDGVNDFAPGEKLATSSSGTGYNAYIAWDAKTVYFGLEGADVAQGAPSANKKWVMLYLGAPGTQGTSTGIAYDCGGTCTAQQAMLQFSAAWHLRYKVDGSYANVQKWNTGTSKWEDAGIAVPLTTGRAGTFLEMAITRASLGNPTKLDVDYAMIIEDTNPPAWTYAGAPSSSFTDGFNPSYSKYFEFDLGDTTTAPNTVSPKP